MRQQPSASETTQRSELPVIRPAYRFVGFALDGTCCLPHHTADSQLHTMTEMRTPQPLSVFLSLPVHRETLGIGVFPLRHSLRSHVIYLENRIQSLRDLLTAHGLNADERQQIERQLAYAELALERYREAYVLELNLSNPQPPDRADTESGGNSEGLGNRDKSNPEKKNRSATVAGRPRKRFVRVAPAGTVSVWRTTRSFEAGNRRPIQANFHRKSVNAPDGQ